MSPEQEEALFEARKLLRPHFDSFCITARLTDESLRDCVLTDWHGPISDVIGQTRVAQIRAEKLATEGDLSSSNRDEE